MYLSSGFKGLKNQNVSIIRFQGIKHNIPIGHLHRHATKTYKLRLDGVYMDVKNRRRLDTSGSSH